MHMRRQDNCLRISVFLEKGGVGKTTSTAHLAVAMAEEGLDVLAIDLAGKQNDLAKHFGIFEEVDAAEEDRWPNISTVFDESWDMVAKKVDGAVDDMIWPTGEGVDVIPAHEGLDAVDDELSSAPAEERYKRFSAFVDENLADRYDAILLDLPGATSNITLNGLWATGSVVAPSQLGEFEEKQLLELDKDLRSIEEDFGVSIRLEMIIPNMVDLRTTLDRELLDAVHEEHPDAVAPDHVPTSQDIKNAQRAGKTVFALEEPSKTAARARNAYQANARELISRLEDSE